jgi:hypothetical protein
MKIEFPMWLVVDPTPVSELRDVVWTFEDFAQMERVLRGGDRVEARGPVLYTDHAEAEHDARARIAVRDAAKAPEWVPLSALRPGAIFETREGRRGTKITTLADGRADWIEDTGDRWFTSEPLLVREIKL